MSAPPLTEEQKRRIGILVYRRRVFTNMSVSRAAKAADISRTTWLRIENAEPVNVRAAGYAAIERLFGWEPGTLRRFALSGVKPPMVSHVRHDDARLFRILLAAREIATDHITVIERRPDGDSGYARALVAEIDAYRAACRYL